MRFPCLCSTIQLFLNRWAEHHLRTSIPSLSLLGDNPPTRQALEAAAEAERQCFRASSTRQGYITLSSRQLAAAATTATAAAGSLLRGPPAVAAAAATATEAAADVRLSVLHLAESGGSKRMDSEGDTDAGLSTVAGHVSIQEALQAARIARALRATGLLSSSPPASPHTAPRSSPDHACTTATAEGVPKQQSGHAAAAQAEIVQGGATIIAAPPAAVQDCDDGNEGAALQKTTKPLPREADSTPVGGRGKGRGAERGGEREGEGEGEGEEETMEDVIDCMGSFLKSGSEPKDTLDTPGQGIRRGISTSVGTADSVCAADSIHQAGRASDSEGDEGRKWAMEVVKAVVRERQAYRETMGVVSYAPSSEIQLGGKAKAAGLQDTNVALTVRPATHDGLDASCKQQQRSVKEQVGKESLPRTSWA